MYILGMVISVCAFPLVGVLLGRGASQKLFNRLPVFYSYLVFVFSGTLGMYVVYLVDPHFYPSAYWIYYLITILAEFMVLVEISDQVFLPFPAIRNLGRAVTIAITAALGCIYILPAIVESTHRRAGLLSFALRACVTKAIILAALFYAARRYGCRLGRNIAGLMLGFSIYLALNITLMAAGIFLDPAVSSKVLWIMEPLSFALCILVWTVSLWEFVPTPHMESFPTALASDAETVALDLIRFNGQLTKLLHKQERSI